MARRPPQDTYHPRTRSILLQYVALLRGSRLGLPPSLLMDVCAPPMHSDMSLQGVSIMHGMAHGWRSVLTALSVLSPAHVYRARQTRANT